MQSGSSWQGSRPNDNLEVRASREEWKESKDARSSRKEEHGKLNKLNKKDATLPVTGHTS